MSSDPINLPHGLADWKNRINIEFKYDDKCLKASQGPTPISIPDCPVQPMVTLQCIASNGEAVGPLYVYEYDLKDWSTFNERIHEVPQSTPVDVEVPVPQPEPAESPVELSVESAPVSEVPPVDEAPELEQPPEDESSPNDDHDLGGEDW